jgi:soluble lytic murein transglycosylase-like protein
MKNCPDWEQDIGGESESAGLEEHLRACGGCQEFAQELEKNRAALRELPIQPAAFAAVRQRVLSEIESKKRRTMWWTWSAAAAAACVAILCVSYVLPRLEDPAAPAVVALKRDPPKIEWTPRPVAHRVRRPHSSGWSRAQATPARKTEPLAVIKMLTNDPNVIIIWLVDQKGDSL